MAGCSHVYSRVARPCRRGPPVRCWSIEAAINLRDVVGEGTARLIVIEKVKLEGVVAVGVSAVEPFRQRFFNLFCFFFMIIAAIAAISIVCGLPRILVVVVAPSASVPASMS